VIEVFCFFLSSSQKFSRNYVHRWLWCTAVKTADGNHSRALFRTFERRRAKSLGGREAVETRKVGEISEDGGRSKVCFVPCSSELSQHNDITLVLKCGVWLWLRFGVNGIQEGRLDKYYSLRPTQPGHPSVAWCNEYWRWFWRPLGKKRRVLRCRVPCDRDC